MDVKELKKFSQEELMTAVIAKILESNHDIDYDNELASEIYESGMLDNALEEIASSVDEFMKYDESEEF